MAIGTYNANFTVGATIAGFDVNQSGYGETNEANTTIRPIPWAATYSVVVLVGGLNPRTRTYQVTVYSEQDYGALRALVGQQGLLTTSREGSPTPGQAQSAVLTSVRRGGYQYPGFPGPRAVFPGSGADLQTLVLDFVMLV